MLSELMFIKWVVFFEQNCIVKWVIFVASFCWLWDSKSELMYKICLYIFDFRFSGRVSKPTPNKKFWIIYFLAQILFFETVLEPFSQCNFKIFYYQLTMVTNIFTHPPSSLSYEVVLYVHISQLLLSSVSSYLDRHKVYIWGINPLSKIPPPSFSPTPPPP